MLSYGEMQQVAEDMYANETTYIEWRNNLEANGFSATPHLYAAEMVAFWSDPWLGPAQVALDPEERDIVINMIEEKAKQEVE